MLDLLDSGDFPARLAALASGLVDENNWPAIAQRLENPQFLMEISSIEGDSQPALIQGIARLINALFSLSSGGSLGISLSVLMAAVRVMENCPTPILRGIPDSLNWTPLLPLVASTGENPVNFDYLIAVSRLLCRTAKIFEASEVWAGPAESLMKEMGEKHSLQENTWMIVALMRILQDSTTVCARLFGLGVFPRLVHLWSSQVDDRAKDSLNLIFAQSLVKLARLNPDGFSSLSPTVLIEFSRLFLLTGRVDAFFLMKSMKFFFDSHPSIMIPSLIQGGLFTFFHQNFSTLEGFGLECLTDCLALIRTALESKMPKVSQLAFEAGILHDLARLAGQCGDENEELYSQLHFMFLAILCEPEDSLSMVEAWLAAFNSTSDDQRRTELCRALHWMSEKNLPEVEQEKMQKFSQAIGDGLQGIFSQPSASSDFLHWALESLAFFLGCVEIPVEWSIHCGDLIIQFIEKQLKDAGKSSNFPQDSLISAFKVATTLTKTEEVAKALFSPCRSIVEGCLSFPTSALLEGALDCYSNLELFCEPPVAPMVALVGKFLNTGKLKSRGERAICRMIHQRLKENTLEESILLQIRDFLFVLLEKYAKRVEGPDEEELSEEEKASQEELPVILDVLFSIFSVFDRLNPLIPILTNPRSLAIWSPVFNLVARDFSLCCHATRVLLPALRRSPALVANSSKVSFNPLGRKVAEILGLHLDYTLSPAIMFGMGELPIGEIFYLLKILQGLESPNALLVIPEKVEPIEIVRTFIILLNEFSQLSDVECILYGLNQLRDSKAVENERLIERLTGLAEQFTHLDDESGALLRSRMKILLQNLSANPQFRVRIEAFDFSTFFGQERPGPQAA